MRCLVVITVLLAYWPASVVPADEQRDWVPYSQLNRAQQAQEPAYSCGAYIEPAGFEQSHQDDANNAPIAIEADASHYDQAAVATLTGRVKIRQANRQLESDHATFNPITHHADFAGNVRLREPGLLVLGDRGTAQWASGQATVENAAYILHRRKLRGQARRIVRHEDATLSLTDATYTGCPPGDASWVLSSQRVHLNPHTGVGTARNATLRVQGLPILYTPYLRFSIDERRQSGWLAPTLAQDSDNGFTVIAPYYLNLAPACDATLTPQFMSKRGLLLENELRYRTAHSHGELGAAGLVGDHLLAKDPIKQRNPYYEQTRWLVNWQHHSQLSKRWRLTLNYTDTSDKNYLDDFQSQLNIASRSLLHQQLQSQYTGGDDRHRWQLTAGLQRYQNQQRTTDDPYNKLPQVVWSGQWQVNDKLAVHYLADYSQFSRAQRWRFLREIPDSAFTPSDSVFRSIYDEGYGIRRAAGGRAYVETGMRYTQTGARGFVTPAITIKHVQYSLRNLMRQEVIDDLVGHNYPTSFTARDYTERPHTTVPVISLESGLSFAQSITLYGAAFTHRWAPRVKYLYVPYAQQQTMQPLFDTTAPDFSYAALWQDNRFTGYDRLADAHQLTWGFTTHLTRKGEGVECIRLGLGQILYFKQRDVFINPLTGAKPTQDWSDNLIAEQDKRQAALKTPTSPLAAELVYTMSPTQQLQQTITWNPHNNAIENYRLDYRYQAPQVGQRLHLRYRYQQRVARYVKDRNNQAIPDATQPTGYQTTGNNLSQAGLTATWPVTRRWSALGRWQYDLTNNRSLAVASGLEYNHCCYQVRWFWQTWIKPDDNIDHPTPKRGIFLQFLLRGLGSMQGGTAKRDMGALSDEG